LSGPAPRAVSEAAARGYNLNDLRARQVSEEDFANFDYILAMDRANLSDLDALCPPDFDGHLGLFLAFAPDAAVEEVPDPYHGGAQGFTRAIDLIEAASDGLLDHLAGDGRAG